MLRRQSVESQMGEIEFRSKLVQQQVEGEHIFDDEFDAEGIEKILRERMEDTLRQMTSLKEDGLVLSPYVEIGAERCQRSLVMENHLAASGAAVDISYHTLKSCHYYRKVFGKARLPLRICCDANTLPFLADSVPFIFCYQTLHHFPDPRPIAKQIHRVLAPGGYLYFAEEPYRRLFRFHLRRGAKQPRGREVEHGIVENQDIPIGVWKGTFNLFEEKQVTLRSWKGVESSLYAGKNMLSYLQACLFGGSISGLCRKLGDGIKECGSILQVLGCPSCVANGQESPLNQAGTSFVCGRCSRKFPVVDGVVFLFSWERFKTLYPEIYEREIEASE